MYLSTLDLSNALVCLSMFTFLEYKYWDLILNSYPMHLFNTIQEVKMYIHSTDLSYLYGLGYLCQKAIQTWSQVLLSKPVQQKYFTIVPGGYSWQNPSWIERNKHVDLVLFGRRVANYTSYYWMLHKQVKLIMYFCWWSRSKDVVAVNQNALPASKLKCYTNVIKQKQKSLKLPHEQRRRSPTD